MSTQQDAAEVTVVLTGCAPQDADAVFGALGTAFPASSRSAQRTGRTARGGHPVVWTDCIDVRTRGAAVPQVALSGPVRAALLGGTRAVEEIRGALARAFGVEEQGRVAGDQEVEIRLRLTAAARR